MWAQLQSLLSSCRSIQGQSLYWGLALAGLVGGATHCVAMCTPLLLAAGAGRASTSRMLALHAGRLASYAALGALSASLSRLIWADPLFARAATLLLVLAALLMVLAALPVTRLAVAQVLVHLYRPLAPRLFQSIARLRPLPPLLRMAGTGMLLGLMPCSMILAALLAVSATGNPVQAATGMAIFVVATLPSLWLSVRFAEKTRTRFGGRAGWLEPAAMLVSAAVLMSHARGLMA